MTAFWRNWLTIWCIAAGVFGAVLVGGGTAATDGPARAVLALLNPDAADAMTGTLRFALALMGAVTIGWALTMYAGLRAAYLLGPAAAPVWRMLTAAVVVWYIVDSSLSVVTGFALNAVSNTGFLIGFLLPVWRSGVAGGGAATARA